jgi:hypothetical protein
MNLASGGLSATDLVMNTWQRITPISRYPRPKKITMVAWIFTNCEYATSRVQNNHWKLTLC